MRVGRNGKRGVRRDCGVAMCRMGPVLYSLNAPICAQIKGISRNCTDQGAICTVQCRNPT